MLLSYLLMQSLWSTLLTVALVALQHRSISIVTHLLKIEGRGLSLHVT
jgi:hypothetical protein